MDNGINITNLEKCPSDFVSVGVRAGHRGNNGKKHQCRVTREEKVWKMFPLFRVIKIAL